MDSVEQLEKKLAEYNAAYRRGTPQISDREYDRLVEELRSLDPHHPFLSKVEPEEFPARQEVKHPYPMLSTEKAYTPEQLQRFVDRVEKEAAVLSIDEVTFRVTPKLDGLAARDDGTVFVTRGNGEVGYEISSVFEKGVISQGGRGLGLGEIVIVQSYFEKYLATEFKHPRNMVVGIVNSDTLNKFAQEALTQRKVRFVPYVTLPHWLGRGDELVSGMSTLKETLYHQVDYLCDGLVAEVTDTRIQRRLGATTHHYRWQIAIKERGETAVTTVKEVRWQVGRTGNVTPVLIVKPVSLSGATIRRVTAHHANMIKQKQIGPGAQIEIIRSGEVIPKLERVLQPSQGVPTICPTCDYPLVWNTFFLKCENPICTAQVEQTLSHWFKTLGNIDWFGIKTIQKIVAQGYRTLEQIYKLKEDDFQAMGFGRVQSKNLSDAIAASLSKPVEDWRFLAAFGIPELGKGDSRKLLAHIPLENILSASEEQIASIHGFGSLTSSAIVRGIRLKKQTIAAMIALDFKLQKTPLDQAPLPSSTPLTGKGIVFSGKMIRGTREQMQATARQLGARVQTAVSGKTDYLVCGENVGQRKLEKARELGIECIGEDEFFSLIRPFIPE